MPSRVIGSNVSEAPQRTNAKTRRGLSSVLGLHSYNSRPASPTPPPVSSSSFLRSAQAHAEKEKVNTLRERRSLDVTSSGSGSYFVSLSYRKKAARTREDRASVTDISFFQSNTPSLPSTPKLTSVLPLQSDTINLNSPDSKKKMTKTLEIPQERASRRKMARIEAQDGPWSVSVAESPYDKRCYSIYIKTPTHHMTLTRTGQEIQDLHRKIVSAHADLALPDVPLQNQDESVDGLADKKRKSSFLHTLSRLASPGPNRRERPKDTKTPHTAPSSRNSLAGSANPQSSPMSQSISASTPGKELDNWDPFTSPLATPSDASSAMSTALAGYLTALANEPALKQSKSWRRFVRIRTEDLISERVERAVKRVRSDLAAHLSGSKHQLRKAEVPDDASIVESAVMVGLDGETDDSAPPKSEELNAGIIGKIREEEEDDARNAENRDKEDREDGEASAQDVPGTPRPGDILTRGSIEIPDASKMTSTKSVSTPTETNAVIASRIPRSQSADPDKATRMSRIFEASPLKNDGDESTAEYESEAQIETEVEEARSTTTMDDDSSISTSGVKHKGSRSKFALRSKNKLLKKAKAAKKVVIDDFEMMRVLGKGCAGKVLLVRHKKSQSLYALKAITKRHVLAHQELQHTLTEQAVLKRMAREAKDPFVVKLWWSFHDKENLFLVMDFHPGGDLATQLARWGRLGRDRARFYAAEIVEGVDGLHAAGVIYRDLKPENILIGADGHIVLTDFGLSKEFPRRTSPNTAPATPSGSRTEFHPDQQPLPHWMKGEDKSAWPIGQNDSTSTFCGTAEYLAPEVIQGQPYSYEVDWWSFGTMLYEMLTGITPFWANNHSEMYVRVLQDELKFPEDRVMDQDTKSLIRGLLQRNPALRMKQPRIKRHPYFSMIDWSHVYYKRYIPPYIPPIDPLNASDTQNFDDTFLDMEPVIADENEQAESGEDRVEGGEKTDGEEVALRTPAQSRSSSTRPLDEEADLFDGYSFKGRHSVLIDDEDDEVEAEEEDGGGDEIDDEEDIQRLANADVGQTAEDEMRPSEEIEEPKTPEARKADLPVLTPAEEIAALHKAAIAIVSTPESLTPVKDIGSHVLPEKTPEVTGAEEDEQMPPALLQMSTIHQPVAKPVPSATTSRFIAPFRNTRTRREKSGIHALDKYLSDGGDEDDAATERDEDDDWDFIEAPGAGAEDRNGAKGTSLFARGVVDRYRLAVFRKSTTPSKSSQQRNVSGMSLASDITTAEACSPSPSEKQRRGRNPGLTFRRNPKQFLRARTPPSSNASTNGTGKTSIQPSKSNTVSSVTSSSTGILTPSTSTHPSTMAGPSLKSKESTTSVASSDDQSINGDTPQPSTSADLDANGAHSTNAGRRVIAIDEPEKPKPKKLKKYKEGAEKVLSLFASPR